VQVSSPTKPTRQQLGITQRQLATRAGVSARTVATLEAGGNVSAKIRERIAAALQTASSAPENAYAERDAITANPLKAKPAPKVPDVIYVSDQKRGVSKALRELPAYGILRWDEMGAIRAALNQHMMGQFQLSAQMLDAMMGDDRITGVLSARIDGLLGLPMLMKTPDGLEDDEHACDVAKRAQTLWPQMAPESSLRELIRWGRGLGVAVWENLPIAGDVWTRKIKVWHPRFLYWVWDITKQPYSGSYKLITGDGLVDLQLGDDGLVHSVGSDGIEEIGRFGLYTPFGYVRGWYHGLVRALAIPWVVRNLTLRDWSRYSEIHGIPIRAVTMPAEWDPAQRARAEAEIAVLGNESVVTLLEDKDGRGFKLSLIEPTAQSEDAFEKLIAKCDTCIAVAVLGQNLTTEIGGGGSRSAAQVHDHVRDDIIRSDAETVSTTLRAQALAPWTMAHEGSTDCTPWPHWLIETPEDKGSRASALLATSQAIVALRKDSQLPIDYAELCEDNGVPLKEDAEIADFVPAVPASPFAPEPGQQAVTKARIQAKALKTAMLTAKLSRRDRAPHQGQAYVDQIVESGRDASAKLLSGDVRALRKVVANAKADADGKVDGPALKVELLRAYGEMTPDKLARVIASARLLAELSGRYAVVKEVVNK